MKQSTHHLRAVTGARFFAALAVLSFHFSINNAERIPQWIAIVIKHGDIAVNFFFVLSGFILAYNYCDRPIQRQSFWWSRFARIYPVYLLALLIGLPFFIHQLATNSLPIAQLTSLRFLMEALLVQAWFPFHTPAINPPGWSISTEMLFYAIFPWIASYLSKLDKRQLLRIAAIIYVLAIAIQIPLLFLRLQLQTGTGGPVFADFMAYFPPLHLPGFLIGAVAGTLYKRNYRFGLDRLTVVQKTAVDCVLLLLCAILIITNPVYSLMNEAIIIPFLALLIMSLACEGSLISSVLASRPLFILGESSYALYILQIPISLALRFVIEQLGFGATALYTLSYVPILIALTIASHYVVERPARQKIVQTVHAYQRRKLESSNDSSINRNATLFSRDGRG